MISVYVDDYYQETHFHTNVNGFVPTIEEKSS